MGVHTSTDLDSSEGSGDQMRSSIKVFCIKSFFDGEGVGVEARKIYQVHHEENSELGNFYMIDMGKDDIRGYCKSRFIKVIEIK